MYRVTGDDGQTVVYVAAAGTRRWAFHDGHTYVIEPAGGRTRTSRHDADALRAPMPATVVALHAAPGQDVAAGDVLVVLEAMKMELQIRAPRAGRVRSVACRPGELVQPGLPLVELE
jgi:biotin carboxyl carrier protein